jgi:hypothetical protein
MEGRSDRTGVTRMSEHKITVNRAPVLTLWAAVVAERLGFEWPEALTLGKAVAGLNAQSKGRALGIFTAPQATKQAAERPGQEVRVELLGREVRCVQTDEGLRALNKGRPVKAESVETYLARKLGDGLPRAREAMTALAQALDPADLRERAFSLYEAFRPSVPKGARGWGQAGELDLNLIRSLARR